MVRSQSFSSQQVNQIPAILNLTHKSASRCDVVRENDWTLLIAFSFLEQLQQAIFPQRSECVTAMATRLVARLNHDRTPVGNALDLALENPQLRRINQIIGRVDCQKRCANFFETGTRIVVM